MEETIIQEEFTFPEKPVIEEKSSSMWKSVGSMVLFIAAYYIFFDKDINNILILANPYPYP